MHIGPDGRETLACVALEHNEVQGCAPSTRRSKAFWVFQCLTQGLVFYEQGCGL